MRGFKNFFIFKRGFDDEETGVILDLIIRSPIYHVSKISAPIFLLHRNGNPVVRETEAMDFYKAMLAAGKACSLVVRDKMLENDEQIISYKEVLFETESWLDNLMRKE